MAQDRVLQFGVAWPPRGGQLGNRLRLRVEVAEWHERHCDPGQPPHNRSPDARCDQDDVRPDRAGRGLDAPQAASVDEEAGDRGVAVE